MTNQERPIAEQDEVIEDISTTNGAIEGQDVPAEQEADSVETGAVAEHQEASLAGESQDSASLSADQAASAEGSTESEAATSEPAGAAPLFVPELSSAAEGEPQTEGASYTPVEEDGRPRRVKDLESGMELEGRVTSIALYGIFVDIGVGRDGLVHISEMSDTRIDSPSDVVQIGDTVHVRVKSVEPDGRRISLTMRSKEREGRGRGRPKKPELNRDALSTLRVGDIVDGTVTGIAPFGVFVDIGVGKDGLVHISELSEGRIDKAEDAVQVGQSYQFKLLEIDAEGTRISLSLRRAQRSQRMQQLESGQIVEGTVSGVATFGAFVDIGVGRDGLVHISELSEGHVSKVEDVVNVGDKIKVRVLDLDSQSKRISLSMLLEERPKERAEGEAPQAQAQATRAPRPPREDRPRREDRPDRAPRQQSQTPVTEVYSSSDEPEEEIGNATLEDLLSKYGNGNKRDRKRRREDYEDEVEERGTGGNRRQRDAIRRTLQHLNDE